MLCTDRIIVLSHTRFSDSSIIVRALSRQHGRVSLMVYGFGGKSRSKLGAFHPMALLDVVYSYKPDRDIQKLTEYRPAPNLVSCTADLRKSTLLMFMAEVVGKSIREEAEDDAQFEFIDVSVQILEQMQAGLQFFHLAFMVKLSRIIGFFPNIDASHPPSGLFTAILSPPMCSAALFFLPIAPTRTCAMCRCRGKSAIHCSKRCCSGTDSASPQ